MDNVHNLRNELNWIHNEVKSGSLDALTAKVLIAGANAMLKSVALELEYAKLKQEITGMPFLEEKKEDTVS